MMISPGSYVEMHLKGKSMDDAMKEVKSLKRVINRLKKILEEYPYSDECMIHPSPEVRISVSRDYLSAAKAFFQEQGWEYPLSRDEINDMKFNERIKDIVSINIKYGGFPFGGKGRKIRFDGENIIVENYTYPIADPEMLEKMEQDLFEEMTRSELLEELHDLHMGEWKKDYTDLFVMDGIQWEVKIGYADGTETVFSGSNAFPYNFKRFLGVVLLQSTGIV